MTDACAVVVLPTGSICGRPRITRRVMDLEPWGRVSVPLCEEHRHTGTILDPRRIKEADR